MPKQQTARPVLRPSSPTPSNGIECNNLRICTARRHAVPEQYVMLNILREGHPFYRRLATGNVQSVCTLHLRHRPPIKYFKIFLGYRSRTRTLTLNPKP